MIRSRFVPLFMLVALAALGAANAFGDDVRGVKTPPFERVQLPNGAVLLLMERHDVPLIAFNAVLRGGAASGGWWESGQWTL